MYVYVHTIYKIWGPQGPTRSTRMQVCGAHWPVGGTLQSWYTLRRGHIQYTFSTLTYKTVPSRLYYRHQEIYHYLFCLPCNTKNFTKSQSVSHSVCVLCVQCTLTSHSLHNNFYCYLFIFLGTIFEKNGKEKLQ